ncbi:hypothetical protein QBC39DRAFT_358008 [Podospora conica]|nr:hypothetical protein QBC39DRAFT_358008 [Schizothecium conicum]
MNEFHPQRKQHSTKFSFPFDSTAFSFLTQFKMADNPNNPDNPVTSNLVDPANSIMAGPVAPPSTVVAADLADNVNPVVDTADSATPNPTEPVKPSKPSTSKKTSRVKHKAGDQHRHRSRTPEAATADNSKTMGAESDEESSGLSGGDEFDFTTPQIWDKSAGANFVPFEEETSFDGSPLLLGRPTPSGYVRAETRTQMAWRLSRERRLARDAGVTPQVIADERDRMVQWMLAIEAQSAAKHADSEQEPRE